VPVHLPLPLSPHTLSLHDALPIYLPAAAMRAYYNLSNLLYYHDRYDDALSLINEGLTMARRLGYRNWEWPFLAELTFVLFMQGRSEEHTSELQSHLNLVCRLLLEK